MKRIIGLRNKHKDERSSFRSRKLDKVLHKEGYTLLYLGQESTSDLSSLEDILSAVIRVKQNPLVQSLVKLVCRGIELCVIQGEKELLVSLLMNIGHCVQHTSPGFNDCFAISLNSGPWGRQCHIFQAKSSRQAADIVQSVQKHIKVAVKSLRRRTEIPSVFIQDIELTKEEQNTPMGAEPRIIRRRKSDSFLENVAGEESTSTSHTSRSGSMVSLAHMIKTSPAPKGWRRKKEGKDFGRTEKIELVSIACNSVCESNKEMRLACSNPHPQSPFERALHAINFSSDTLLSQLLSQQLLEVESCDHDANTLMHYAVAMQKVDCIELLHNRRASIEHPNNQYVHPLHRAVVGNGDKHVLMTLLERGASVNAVDMYKNTPLHYAACRKEQHESCWILLQYGAMVTKQNDRGIRPLDLLPDLKEMQSRLIISMCKAFSEPQDKPVATEGLSLSPPSSHSEGNGLRELEQAKDQTRSSRPKVHKRKFKKYSRSISNLSELLEAEEDEMNRQDRQQKLRFPTEQTYQHEYFEIEGKKDEIEKRLNELIRHGKSAKRTLKRSTSDPEITNHINNEEDEEEEEEEEEGERRSSHHPSQLYYSDKFRDVLRVFQKDIPPPRPYTPTVPPRYPPSQPSPTTLSAAFDSLQQDLELTSNSPQIAFKNNEIVKISPRTVHRNFMQKNSCPSPIQQGKSKNETLAILDDYISQILTAAGELNNMTPASQKSHSGKSISEVSNPSEKKSLEIQNQGSPVFKRKYVQTRFDSNQSRYDGQESSSSETRRRNSSQDSRPHGHMQSGSAGSNFSFTPSSSLSSLQYPSHHGSLTGFSIDVDSAEPGAQSLRVLNLLASNSECIQTLIAHICLSDFKDRLLSLACSQQSSMSLICSIASLVQNIFECGGSEGRKTALESGMMDIIVKLLSSRDPIPGTCLNLLNSLLVSNDENDYLHTIVKIPCDPLLLFLEPCESDADSGVGSQKDPSRSSTTTSDHQPLSNLDDGRHTLIPTKDRAYSLTSDSSSGHSAASPSLQGNIVTHVEARRIVLKMLSQSSTHEKVKVGLSELRTIALLMDYLSDPSQENLTNAVITLANIAENIKSHPYLIEIGVIEKLRVLINSGPRPRYHAIRTLVYLGKLQLSGNNLFDNLQYESESMIKATDTRGHTYVRGITLEMSIDLITSNPRSLWGGINLRETSSGHHLSREKTVEFFLTTYRSFVHPLIFMRLLLHRLDMWDINPNPFDWSHDINDDHHIHVQEIPPIHQAVLNLIGQWMETFPSDFRNNPELQEYVSEQINYRLRKFRGVYTPHTHRLRSLLHETNRTMRKRTDSVTPSSERHTRVPHHENLYIQCKQLISEDLLPVTLETAAYLCGLQLHIETIADNTLNKSFMEGGVKGKKESRIFLTHLKHALPAWCFRVKNIGKRIREKLNDCEGLSDRIAKHMYIEKCQSTPGYNCSFYSVKVPSVGKFRRGTSSQLLGISDHQIIFLDDKTRDLVQTYNLQEVKRVHHDISDPCTIIIQLKCGTRLQVNVERESTARQIEIIMDNLGQKVLDDIEKEDIDDWITNWGVSPSSLHTSAGLQEESHSIPSSPDQFSKELEDTIIPMIKDEEQHEMTTPTTVKANGTPTTLIPQLENSILTDTMFVYPEGTQPKEDQPVFCDCPPDPEIPLHIDIRLLSLQEILRHPVEVARQITLIEHERLYTITREELMQRAGLYPKGQSNHSHSPSSIQSTGEGRGIERLANRFNQLGNWVVHCVLQYTQEEDRGWVIQQYITIANYCLQYRNFSSTMAIVAGGLCTPPIRRLRRTWEHVGKPYKEQLEYMKELLDSRNNFKHFRELIDKTQIPAVPYFGIFTKDLTFISDGNPDYLRNTINLHKRRQIFAQLEEIRHFQSERYNFEPVLPLQTLLTDHVLVQPDELHSLSHSMEPSQVHSEGRNRSASISSLTNIGFNLKQSFSSVKTSGSFNKI